MTAQNAINKGAKASLNHYIFDAQSRQFSLIPLIGGDGPTIGKRPALPWKPYQTRHATPTEIETWLAAGMSAYGVVKTPIRKNITASW